MSSTFSQEVYLPSNLNVQNHITLFPPVKIPSFSSDKLIYIIGLINSIPSNNKRLYTPDGYVPIHAATLQNNINDYRLYLDYLIETGILESDNFYIPGSKSYSFRFTQDYNSLPVPCQVQKYTIRKLIAQQNIFGGIKAAKAQRKEKLYSYLSKWFNGDLKLDIKANDYLVEQFNLNLKNTSDYKARRKYYLQRLSLDRITNRDYFFIVDDTAGRLHTNLTNLPSGARNYLTYAGLKLVSVDIKNSQPFISSALLNENFYLNQETKLSTSNSYNYLKLQLLNQNYNTTINLQGFINEYNYKNINTTKRVSEIVSSLMIGKSEVSVAAVEFQQYIDLTGQGLIYEYIENAVAGKTGKVFKDRKELKAIIFQVLFTDNRFFGQKEAEAKRIFYELFPNVYNLFAKIKRGESATLPRLLQAIEAKIILDRVCFRIFIENPYLPIFTIHDSVVCPVGHESYVSTVIREEMQSAIGYIPTLKTEYWSPDSLYS